MFKNNYTRFALAFVTLFVCHAFPLAADAASTTVDSFVRQVSEVSPYNLQSHTASNGSTWTKVNGSVNLQLTGASSSVTQSGASLNMYVNSTPVGANLEIGALINKGTATSGFNFMTPILRSNATSSTGTMGLWAEADFTMGTIGIRRSYSSNTYVLSPVTGFTFPQDDYYVVFGVSGSVFSMYVKQMSTGMWLSRGSKAFDSASKVAVASSTDATQNGTLIGLTSYTTYATGKYILKQFDVGDVGELTGPVPPVVATSSAPYGLAAVGGNAQVTLTWSVPVSDGASSIQYYRVRSAESGLVVATSSVASTTVTGIVNNSSQGFYVTAVNGVGESSPSATVYVTPFSPTTLPVNNASFDKGLSPYVWYKDGANSITSSGGSNGYFKVGFTGSAFGISTDVSTLVATSVNAIAYPVLKYRIDGGAYQFKQVTSTSSILYLARDLAAGNHTIEAHYQRNIYYDVWDVPVMQLKITGVVLDSSSATLSDFPIRPKRMLIYGDSITEGQWIDDSPGSAAGTGQANGGGAFIANATRVYAAQVANSLNAEFGNAGIAGQRWTGGSITGFTTTWNSYYSGRSRLVAGKIDPAPDYVLVNMGTNGGNDVATIEPWLSSLRSAVSTSTIVYLVVPFSGSGRAAITTSYQNHMVTNPTDRTYLIDLGTITGYTTTDGLHPDGPGNDVVAGLIINAIATIGVPTAPQNFTASGSSDSTISLTWDAPTSNGSSTILGYNIYSGFGTLVGSTPNVASTSLTVSGLVSGTSYSYYVKAYNAIGESVASATVTKSTAGTAPSAGTVYAPGSITAVSSAPMSAAELARVFGLATPAKPGVACPAGALFNSMTGERCATSGTSAPVTGTPVATPSTGSFKVDLSLGITHPDVKALQQFLNAKGFTVSVSGAGSLGKETSYFGPATKAVLAKYQAANKISPAIGNFGPLTRKFILGN